MVKKERDRKKKIIVLLVENGTHLIREKEVTKNRKGYFYGTSQNGNVLIFMGWREYYFSNTIAENEMIQLPRNERIIYVENMF